MSAPTVFLSYSHDSDAHRTRVKALADRLIEDGLEVLLDRYAPPGGPREGWATWMENGLEAADKVMVVCTATYLRRYQKKEAPQKGKGVTWEGAILKQALYDAQDITDKFAAVIFAPEDEVFIPPVLRERNWYRPADDKGYEALYRFLTDQPETTRPAKGKLKRLPPKSASGVHGTVPNPPPHYLLRTQMLAHLSRQLFITDTTSVTITGQGAAVGIQGMGGVGKTVLAAALTRDPAVQRVFPDGIFWLIVGQQPNLLAVMNQLAGWLPDCGGLFTSEPEAQTAIRQALAGKHALLILDDVWHLDHAAALNLVSAPGRLLVTTRKREVLVGLSTQEFCVDVLSQTEALRMLADWAGVKETALLPPEASDVAQECGRLPLALAMIGAMVQLRPTAWPDALEFLRSRDLEEFRRAFPDYPYPDLLRAIAVSVDELLPEDRERYLDLAVFPEDAPIPEGPLQVLWGLTPAKTRACMDRLAGRSLATVKQIGSKATLLLHDLQGDYIRKQREKQLPALHTHLLDAYAARCEVQSAGDWPSGPNDGYFFQRLAWHLKQAGRNEELRSLLLDFEWIEVTLNVTDLVTLLANFDHLKGDEEVGLVQSAIRLSSHALGLDKTQLASQIVGRLSGETTPQIQQMVASACAWRGAPWLRPLHGNLHPPGTALFRTLLGHVGGVNAVAMSSEGDLAVSGSADGTLLVWDLQKYRKPLCLRGHTGEVTAVALCLERRLVLSASRDQILKLWDLDNGQLLRTLKGHKGWITAAKLSSNGRIAVSASADRTVRVWDLQTGRGMFTLNAPWGIAALAITSDGRRAVSGAWDKTLTLWDLVARRRLRTMKGHKHWVTAAALSSDGRRALSGSADHTIKVWDLETGRALATLRGHTGTVWDVAITPDDRFAVSASEDDTIGVWDLQKHRRVRVFKAHYGGVKAVALAAGGHRAISASHDHSLMLWDLEATRNPPKVRGHGFWVQAVAQSSDGKYAVSTTSFDLKLWEIETGRELRTLERDFDDVTSVAMSADGRRAVSGSDDQTLKVWDVGSGRELRTLKGHTDGVNAVALSADGRRAVSGSDDQTLKVWDVGSGRELRTLKGHTARVNAVALSADGRRAVSGSDDQTLKVWDVGSGRKLRTLKGHTDGVNAVALSADGRRAVSGSDDQTLKVWDVGSGRELRTLQGDADGVNAVALSVDGRRAVSVSGVTFGGDFTLKLWDVESGQCLATFTGESAILCCSLASDGHSIVAGEQSGRIHFLRLVLPDDPVE